MPFIFNGLVILRQVLSLAILDRLSCLQFVIIAERSLRLVRRFRFHAAWLSYLKYSLFSFKGSFQALLACRFFLFKKPLHYKAVGRGNFDPSFKTVHSLLIISRRYLLIYVLVFQNNPLV